MILFLEDWKKYPGAIIHINTSNKTFLRLAGLYKKMGVKNHAFILALHNPLLKDIDPHDENLTEEQMAMIAEEIQINPWYYFREVARAPSNSGVTTHKLKANRGNIALFWSFFNHITSMLIQPRQTGKSFNTDTLMKGLLSFWTFNTNINLLTKDAKLRAANIERLKDIEKTFPPYLRLITKKDSDNTEGITVKGMGNSYTTHIGQASESAALNIGRGLTSPIFHIDEIAFISNIAITLPTALAAGGAARDAAILSDSPYGTIFTTTAGRRDSKSGKFAYKIYSDGLRWNENLFDCKNQNELQKVVRANSKGPAPVLILEFNHRQLGYTDEWLSRKIEESMSEGIDAETDFLNIWSDGTESSVFDRDILRTLSENRQEPEYQQISEHGYIINWYVKEDIVLNKLHNASLVIGMDTSDAVGNDGIAMVITDSKSGKVLGTGSYNETNLITFSEFVFHILKTLTKSVLIMERRSSGVTIMDNLILLMQANNMDPFKRMFNWVVDEHIEHNARFSEIDCKLERRDRNLYTVHRKHFGFATSGAGKASRDKLYGEALLSAVKYTGSSIKDKTLINQITGLVVKNGRIDHRATENDDMVIAFMLSFYFLTKARNLEFYGFNPYDVLTNVTSINSDVKEDLDKEEYIREQEEIRAAIDELLETLKTTRDQIRIAILTNKLKLLNTYLDNSYSQSLNLEARLEDIKRSKINKRYY